MQLMTKGTKKEQRLNEAMSAAYEYVVNVLNCQKRAIPFETLWLGYSSMGYKPTLSESAFSLLYAEILGQLVIITAQKR